MKNENEPSPEPADPTAAERHLEEAGGGLLGAIGGAGLGILAGPPGIAAGAVIGAVVGTLTSWAMVTGSSEAAAADEELDKEIGVDGGDIGVPGLQHPPAQRGAFSAESAGASATTDSATVAEGPIGAPPNEE